MKKLNKKGFRFIVKTDTLDEVYEKLRLVDRDNIFQIDEEENVK